MDFWFHQHGFLCGFPCPRLTDMPIIAEDRTIAAKRWQFGIPQATAEKIQHRYQTNAIVQAFSV